MIYDLEHRQVTLLVTDVQGEYFDEDGPAYVEHDRDIVGNVNRRIDPFRAEASPIVLVKPGTGLHPVGLDELGDLPRPQVRHVEPPVMTIAAQRAMKSLALARLAARHGIA
jgi:nicotinamidase-related amidase